MTDKSTETAMAQAAPAALVKPEYGIDVGRVIAMRTAVEEVVAKVLREGEHFGVLPGTTGRDGKPPKKMLFQPGAEVLCQVFRLRPQFEVVTRDERDDFIFREVTCKLYNSVTGELVGEASGSANTREEKYVAQTSAKICPTCGKPTIFKSKKDSGGWFCWEKKGGCGAQFSDEDKKLRDQTGTTSADKVWGLHHTVISMAQKRAYVKAVRNATATSDIFTDEDAPPDDDEHSQRGSAGPRTRTAPAAGPKATPAQIRDLSEALTKAGVGTGFPATMPKAEQDDMGKKQRIGWVKQMLEDEDLPAVVSLFDLPPDVCDKLVALAKAGKMPRGW
jgi:hypothetical protein